MKQLVLELFLDHKELVQLMAKMALVNDCYSEQGGISQSLFFAH